MNTLLDGPTNVFAWGKKYFTVIINLCLPEKQQCTGQYVHSCIAGENLTLTKREQFYNIGVDRRGRGPVTQCSIMHHQ